jgi:hypothetical protein
VGSGHDEVTAVGGYLDKLVAAFSAEPVGLAMERVPDYVRASSRGNTVRVSGYSRMGRDAMQSHLTASHGMARSSFGRDFAHPAALGAWHSMDHVARGESLDHEHPGEDHAGQVAHHLAGGGDHEHGGFGAIAAHTAVWEGPAVAHREVRRNLDRQTRRRAYRAISKHKAARKRPDASGAGGAASGASGSSSGGGGGSGGSGGGSGSSGGGQ